MKRYFRKFFFAAALLLCGAAQASDLNRSTGLVFDNGMSMFGATFGAGTSGKSFTEDFTFSYGSMFDVSSAVISIALNSMAGLDLSSFTLSGNGMTTSGSPIVSDGLRIWTLHASNLTPGLYTLSAIGQVTGINGGGFGGNINVAAVPEASSAIMMLGGLTLVVWLALRRRRRAGGGNSGSWGGNLNPA